MVALMVGTDIEDFFPRSAHATGEPCSSSPTWRAAAGPSRRRLTLRRGEVLGIAGPVGAGRTELLRAIFGLDPVRRGTIRVGVASWRRHRRPQRLAQGVGFVSEDRQGRGLARRLSIADNLTLSRLERPGPRPIRLAAAAGAGRAIRISRRWASAAVTPISRSRELSGGNQQKVALARLLHHDVDVFLLDEPTRGIDVGSKAQIYRLIDRAGVRRQGGADGQQLPARAARRLRPHRGDVPRPLGPARPVRELTEHSLLLEATGAERGAPPDATRTHGAADSHASRLKRTLIRSGWPGPLAAWIVIYLVFAALAPDTFATLDNLQTMIRQTTMVGPRGAGHDAGHRARRDRSVRGIDRGVHHGGHRRVPAGGLRARSPRRSAGIAVAARVRPGQRPPDHGPARHAVHRHARRDGDHPRRGQGPRARTEDRCADQLAERPGRRAAARLAVDDLPAGRVGC